MERINLNADAKADAFRWGILGLGHVGSMHAWAIREMKHRLNGFTSSKTKVQSGDATGLVFNIGDIPGPLFDASGMNVSNDYGTLLGDPRIDGIIVCAPTEKHRELAIQIAKSGKHCFLEKPIAGNAKEAAQILDAFRESTGKLVVGHVLPSFPEFALLRAEIRRKGIKNVKELTMTRRVAGFRTDDQADTTCRGGFAMDLGAHDANFIAGIGTPLSVHTTEEVPRYGQYQWLKFDIELNESDGIFQCNVGARGPDNFHHSYKVKFRDGSTLEFDGTNVTRNGKTVSLKTKSVPRIFGDELEIAARFFRGEGDESFLSPVAAQYTLKVLEAAAQSAKSNNPVAL